MFLKDNACIFIDDVDVAGMLVHSCYVATDVGMSQNRQQFIDVDRYVILTLG